MILRTLRTPALKRRNLQDPQKILEALQSFLAAAKNPVLIESGRPALTIDRERLRMETFASGVVLESWTSEGNTVRRVVAVTSSSRTKLELQAKRFAGADVKLSLVDAAATSRVGSAAGQSSEALVRLLLARAFPDARVGRLSGSPDVQNSLSGQHVRGVMKEGGIAWAVVAVPPNSNLDACNNLITTGLLWLQLLRDGRKRVAIVGLRLLLPRGREDRTARLVRFLDPEIAAFEVYVYDARSVEKIEIADAGNQHLILRPRRDPVPLGPPHQEWLAELEAKPYVETIVQADGLRSIRVRGLQFAVVRGRRMFYGLNEDIIVTTSNFSSVVQLAEELAAFRNPGAVNRKHPLYAALPERWLESQLRKNIDVIDPLLAGCRIYDQSLAAHGIDRGIVDLMVCDRHGRLAIIEVKETASLHLPIQALDYWAKTTALLQTAPSALQEAFSNHLSLELPPRLILIAPALAFHSTTERLTRFFSRSVPLERIGITSTWRSQIRKRYHLNGWSRPDQSILHN